jgi:hypothetical protein
LPDQFTITFGTEPIAPPVEYTCGLGEAEGWGRWNNDTRIAIRFDRDLPRAFEARIACAAAPGNIGRVITVIAGGSYRRLVLTRPLTQGLEVASLRFRTVRPGRTIEFLLPHVEASAHDPRLLGLAISSIEIVPAQGVARPHA